MKILDLITFIRDEIPFSYYPNKFPLSSAAPDECAAVKIYPGQSIDEWTGKAEPSFQVLVRAEANGDAKAEEKAYEIFEMLANRKDVRIGDDYLSIIKPVGSAPFYIGEDENYRPVYSMNFNVVIRP